MYIYTTNTNKRPSSWHLKSSNNLLNKLIVELKEKEYTFFLFLNNLTEMM